MLNVKVTRIKHRWHARLLYDGKVFDEMACDDRRDIGYICREMLRWFCKTSCIDSDYASASRERRTIKDKDIESPAGRIWSRGQLALKIDI